VDTSWQEFSTDASVQDLAESLVGGLVSLVRQDRRLFQELMEARANPNNDLNRSAVAISTRIRDGFRAVQDVGLEIAYQRQLGANGYRCRIQKPGLQTGTKAHNRCARAFSIRRGSATRAR
jgi:hypothetical protein